MANFVVCVLAACWGSVEKQYHYCGLGIQRPLCCNYRTNK
jgi:hypothetical protein